jgi:uroporphyrinogen III methyltransferase/synthase
MGMRNLDDLIEKILAGGMDPETPAAVVMNGTLPTQRIATAPLRDLAARAAELRLGAPSVVVIGDVVDLRPELQWRGATPLHGRRVLVTRAQRQGVELANEIRLYGGDPIYFPMIELLRAEDPGPLDRALENLASYDAMLLSSANAVRFVVERARTLGALASLRSGATRIACVGPKTAAAVIEEGLPVSLVAPGKGDAQALLDELNAVFSPANRSFLLPRSEIGRKVLPEGLRAAGARVDEVVAYRNRRPEVDIDGLADELLRRPRPVLTFTSPSTVRNFVEVVRPDARAAMSECVTAAMGDATAAALREVGLRASVVPDRPGARALVAAIVDYVRSSDFEMSDEGEVK